MKSRKIMEVNHDGVCLICKLTDDNCNPYRVYKVWFGHQQQIAKYGDFMSILRFLWDFYMNGLDTMTVPEIRKWLADRTI